MIRARRIASRAAALLCGALVLALATAAGAAHEPRGRWVATWGTAQPLAVETTPDWVEPPPPDSVPKRAPPSPIPPFPQSLADRTVRMIVRTSVPGSRLRLTLSSALGTESVRIGAVHVALREHGSAIVAKSDRAVTFGGRGSFTIEPGALVVSDAVELEAPALADLAVSVYVESAPQVTAHALGRSTTYVARGNAAAARELEQAETNLSYFWLTGVEVLASERAGTIVAFGDSITDGFATTPNAQRSWPDLLAAKLARKPATARRGVVNAGVSGNRVRRALAGASALTRFDRDVLARAGVDWLVLLEGINDITWSALPRAPQNERATAAQIVEGLAQLVDRAHARGVKVLGATLTPMGGLWLYNPETEAMRRAVNDWIRTSGKFDAVVDFDAVTRDPSAPERLAPAFDSGDHIHPNDAGNAAMAAAIDVALFVR